MITFIKEGINESQEDLKAKEFDWLDWYERIERLFIEAQNATDDELFKYNLNTQITETRMLLEMHGLIQPLKFELVFEDE